MCGSVDVRDGDFKAAQRWSDDSAFGNRAYFRFDEEPGQLAVQSARSSDSGQYRCRVDFRLGQTRFDRVNLTIISEYILVACIVVVELVCSYLCANVAAYLMR